MRLMRRKPAPDQPTSEQLLESWRHLVLQQQRGDGLGGTLGERHCRAEVRRVRIRAIEYTLLERAWAEPTVGDR